jgi:hypothetical protein
MLGKQGLSAAEIRDRTQVLVDQLKQVLATELKPKPEPGNGNEDNGHGPEQFDEQRQETTPSGSTDTTTTPAPQSTTTTPAPQSTTTTPAPQSTTPQPQSPQPPAGDTTTTP